MAIISLFLSWQLSPCPLASSAVVFEIFPIRRLPGWARVSACWRAVIGWERCSRIHQPPDMDAGSTLAIQSPRSSGPAAEKSDNMGVQHGIACDADIEAYSIVVSG
jgi:hypothetical protein